MGELPLQLGLGLTYLGSLVNLARAFSLSPDSCMALAWPSSTLTGCDALGEKRWGDHSFLHIILPWGIPPTQKLSVLQNGEKHSFSTTHTHISRMLPQHWDHLAFKLWAAQAPDSLLPCGTFTFIIQSGFSPMPLTLQVFIDLNPNGVSVPVSFSTAGFQLVDKLFHFNRKVGTVQLCSSRAYKLKVL